MSDPNKNQISTDVTRSHALQSGYRLYANDTSSGRPWCWYAESLEAAIRLAEVICADTNQDVEITKYVGRVQIKSLPTEFVAAPAQPGGAASPDL